jgi:hypothetical protein
VGERQSPDNWDKEFTQDSVTLAGGGSIDSKLKVNGDGS